MILNLIRNIENKHWLTNNYGQLDFADSLQNPGHNEKVNGLYVVKIGCGGLTINHPLHPHDIIHVFTLTKQSITEKAAKLYAEGSSLRAVASEARLSKNTIRNHLVKAGVPLRTHSNIQSKEKFNPRKRSIKTAPYGYCLVAGKLLPEPREQVTLQLIIKWWQQGLSHCAITKSLNKKKIKPRKAKEWSQPTISYIIKRHQENNP